MTTDIDPDGLVGARVAFDIADHTATVEGSSTWKPDSGGYVRTRCGDRSTGRS